MVKSKNPQTKENMVISRVKELIALREQSLGRAIQLNEIAEATELDAHTISRWVQPKPFTRIEVKTALKLADYFQVEFAQLFTHQRGT